MYDKLQVALRRDAQTAITQVTNNQERTNEKLASHSSQALGEMGSDLVCPRTGRSKLGSGDSKVAFNALILCAIKALCLLFGVIGRADKDCDLVRPNGTIPDGPAPSSSDRVILVSMDGKPSNTGETRGRDGLLFPPLSWFNDATRLRNDGTLGIEGNGGSPTHSGSFATIVNPRGRLGTLTMAGGSSGSSGTVVGKRVATSS